MDANQIYQLVSQALTSLTPSQLTIEPSSETGLIVTVASQAFGGKRSKDRFDLVWSLLEANAPTLLNSHLWTFELWTDAEFERLGVQNSNGDRPESAPYREAAKDAGSQ